MPWVGVSLNGLTGTSSNSTAKLAPLDVEERPLKRKFVLSGLSSSSSCQERFEGLCRRCEEGDVVES